ncbi:MAG: hypothetical protein ACLFVJ_19330, partial [Persicimonas sp.]
DCAPWACDSGSCQRPNTCADAVDISTEVTQSGGYTLSDEWANYTNDFTDEPACIPMSWDVAGNDLFFAVDLQAGDVLHATADSTGYTNTTLALMTDCSNLAGTCEAGDATETSTESAEIWYNAPTDETVYLLLDNDNSSSSETYDLNVDVQPGCVLASHTPTCQGDDVEYCAPPGQDETYTCPGGGCTSGVCDIETGEFCFDAEDLTTEAQQSGGTTETIDWSMYDSDLDDAVCGLSSSEVSGADAYFRFDLSEGEILSATLDQGASSAEPALLTTTNCPAPDLACGESAVESSGSAEIAYRASADETVYLIATSDTDSPSEDFTLDAEITPSECDPSANITTCADADDLQYCEVPGLYATYTCTNGCANDSCDNPTGEVCLESEDLTADASASGGTTVSGTWNDFANDKEGYNACSISTARSDGEDFFYRIDLAAGETLDASITSTGIVYPMLAITSGCSDTDGSCKASDAPSTTAASLSYTASDAETVYLAVDNDWPSNVGDTFDLDVEIK